jgi:hypothetical protein
VDEATPLIRLEQDGTVVVDRDGMDSWSEGLRWTQRALFDWLVPGFAEQDPLDERVRAGASMSNVPTLQWDTNEILFAPPDGYQNLLKGIPVVYHPHAQELYAGGAINERISIVEMDLHEATSNWDLGEDFYYPKFLRMGPGTLWVVDTAGDYLYVHSTFFDATAIDDGLPDTVHSVGLRDRFGINYPIKGGTTDDAGNLWMAAMYHESVDTRAQDFEATEQQIDEFDDAGYEYTYDEVYAAFASPRHVVKMSYGWFHNQINRSLELIIPVRGDTIYSIVDIEYDPDFDWAGFGYPDVDDGAVVLLVLGRRIEIPGLTEEEVEAIRKEGEPYTWGVFQRGDVTVQGIIYVRADLAGDPLQNSVPMLLPVVDEPFGQVSKLVVARDTGDVFVVTDPSDQGLTFNEDERLSDDLIRGRLAGFHRPVDWLTPPTQFLEEVLPHPVRVEDMVMNEATGRIALLYKNFSRAQTINESLFYHRELIDEASTCGYPDYISWVDVHEPSGSSAPLVARAQGGIESEHITAIHDDAGNQLEYEFAVGYAGGASVILIRNVDDPFAGAEPWTASRDGTTVTAPWAVPYGGGTGEVGGIVDTLSHGTTGHGTDAQLPTQDADSVGERFVLDLDALFSRPGALAPGQMPGRPGQQIQGSDTPSTQRSFRGT